MTYEDGTIEWLDLNKETIRLHAPGGPGQVGARTACARPHRVHRTGMLKLPTPAVRTYVLTRAVRAGSVAGASSCCPHRMPSDPCMCTDAGCVGAASGLVCVAHTACDRVTYVCADAGCADVGVCVCVRALAWHSSWSGRARRTSRAARWPTPRSSSKRCRRGARLCGLFVILCILLFFVFYIFVYFDLFLF